MLAIGDKQAINATFVLIDHGETTRSIPPVYFPSSFSLRAIPKHFLNADKSVKTIKEIRFPNFESLKKELRLNGNFFGSIN